MRFQILPLLIALAGPAFGQSCIAPLDSAADPPALVAVAQPTTRLTSRVVLVVDVSGSMQARPLAQALDVVSSLLEQPLDELEVAIWAFAAHATRWPGHRGPQDGDLPAGWGRLPSPETLEAAQSWLRGKGGHGSTNPLDAMAAAVSENREKISVVLITDGEFDVDHKVVLPEIVRNAQTARQAAGHDPAVVMVFGVGRQAKKMDWLRVIGQEGGGGFFVED